MTPTKAPPHGIAMRKRQPSRTAGIALVAALLASSAAFSEPPPGASKGGRGGGVESFADPQEQPISGAQPAVTGEDAAAPAEKPKPRPRRRRKPPAPKPAPKLPDSPVPGATPAPVAASAPAPLPPFTDWKPLDAENTLVIETQKGRIVVELRPELAPKSVAQVKKLARRGIYDGLLFHRVIDGFVDQTGNPNNHDGGKSDEPNLPPEFTFRLGTDTPHMIAARPSGESEGFIGATPYVSVDEARMASSPDHRVAAWGAYCQGVMGMGRDAAPDSGNSEIFFMREPARRLDRDYTVVGRVVAGLDVVRAITVGEPPVHPDKMTKVVVMADLPDNERPKLMVLNALGAEFKAVVDRERAIKGADFSICDVELPTKAN